MWACQNNYTWEIEGKVVVSHSKYKKYILFQFDDYYPAGGVGDIAESFDTIDEAREYLKRDGVLFYDYEELVDRDTWEVVECELRK